MRTCLALALVLACAAAADVQMKVRVRDGDTGRPLPQARVQANARTYETDADGECPVSAAAGSRIVLVASRQGFYPELDTILVRSGASVSLRLYSTQPRTVIGTVRNGSTGKPMPRALVRLKDGTLSRPADSAGMFAVPFPPGDCELVAARPGFRGFPRRLKVPPGDTLSVDLPLFDTALVVGEIAGRVEVKGLSVACGANVVVEGTQLGAATDQNGDYVISGVPVGTARVTCSYAGCRTTTKVVTVRRWESLILNVQLEPRLPTSKR